MSLGIDAAAAHGFHGLRERRPWAARGRLINQAWCPPLFLSLSLFQPVAQKEMFEMDVVRVRSHSRTNPLRAPERDTVRHSLHPCRLKPLRGSLPGWGFAPRYSYYGVTTGWLVGASPIRDSLSLKVPPVPAWQHFVCNSPFAGRPPPTQPYLSTVHVCRT